jgi:transposase InsO family protein
MARQGYPTGVMVHSDQGSQYCSRDFRALLLKNDCTQSMSRRGNCWDNAVTESFFHTLKGHVVHGSVFPLEKKRMLSCLTILRFITIGSEDILQTAG